jgi:hypothetical protein
MDGVNNTQGRNQYRILVGKSEGMRQLGRSRHVWEYTIKIDLTTNGVCGSGLDHVAKERDQGQTLVNVVKNFQFHKNGKLVHCHATIRVSGMAK